MPLAVPTITGVAQVGRTLTAPAPAAHAGGTPTHAYQWLAGGAAISGATTRTLTLSAAQLGKAITVRVTASQAGFTATTKTSPATKAVIAGVLTAAAPTIAGTAAVGSKLTAKPGSWASGTSFRYRWLADGRPISGADSATLTLTTVQRGAVISVRVAGAKPGYTTVVKVSRATARVMTAGTPKISGTVQIGKKLSVKPGSWTTGARLSFQWYANGTAIRKATGTTFTITRAQRGARITVTVTGRKSGYATVAKTSRATAKVLATSAPTVSGRAIATVTVSAKTGSWTPGTSFTYQWYADGRALSGATGRTLTLTRAHIGKRVSVKVTGRLAGYAGVSRVSAASSAVRSGKAQPATETTCPSGYPIKGNQTTRHTTDWIYHVPGGQYYDDTHPEECFATEEAARQAGYRASLR